MMRTKQLSLFLFVISFLIACQPIGVDPDGSDIAEIEAVTPGESQSSEEQNFAIDQNNLPPSQFSSFTILDTIEYDIQQRLKLVNSGPGSPSKQNLWVALISDDFPYQEVVEREISPGDYQIITDEYGNQFAEFDFADMPPDSEIQVKIEYRVKVNQLQYDLSNCEGELPAFYTDAELHIESQNPQISSLSEELAQDHLTACDQVRAVYDYIGNELVYSYNGGNWGAQAALGKMGTDCTEYASLMMALSRAAGIPARYIEGLNFTPQGEEELARKEHAWLEVFLPGIGWTPMDPTLGRSSINREQYFAKLPPNYVIVSRGRNPSTLRGSSYWTYLYWPGNSTKINIEEGDWVITRRRE
jgi:transglutaminase-like putative cysteine protease